MKTVITFKNFMGNEFIFVRVPFKIREVYCHSTADKAFLSYIQLNGNGAQEDITNALSGKCSIEIIGTGEQVFNSDAFISRFIDPPKKKWFKWRYLDYGSNKYTCETLAESLVTLLARAKMLPKYFLAELVEYNLKCLAQTLSVVENTKTIQMALNFAPEEIVILAKQ